MPRKVKDEGSPPAAGSDAAVKAEIAKGEAQFTEAEKAAPVALAVAKRLRAARKRLNRIADLEGAAAQGKELNADQRETLKSKTGVLAIIDELEKITPLLKEAAAEEVAKGIAAADAKAAARAERRAERERAEQEKAAADAADDGKEEGPSTPPQEGPQEADDSAPAADTAASPGKASGGIDRLLSLLYFSQLFSGSSEYVQQAERNSCLSYDQYSNEEGVLTEADLDRIAKFGGLLLTRHPNKTNSHSEALEECKALAQTWLAEPGAALPEVVASDGTTVGELAAKLEHIMKSDYFTIQPQIQQMQQEGEDGAPPGGASDGEYRGLVVSQAEAVLEPPPPPPVVPHQHAGGLDLHSSLQPQGLPDTLSGGDLTSLHQLQPQQHQQHQQPGHQQLPTQFYGSGIYSGAAAYHPGAKAAFQAVPPTTQYDAPQMPAINFMNNSSLGMDSASEPFAPAPSQPLQQPQEASLPKPPAAPQQPQAPQQAPQQQQEQPGQGAPPQQPAQAQAPAGGFARPPQQGSGGLNASDAEVPAPGRGRGGDRGGRRGGRGGGRYPGYRGGPPGEGRGEYRGEGGRGYRGGYRGGRGRGPPGNPGGNGGPPPQQQQQQGPPPQGPQ